MTAMQIAEAKAKGLGFDTVEPVGMWNNLQVFDYFNSEDPEGGDVGLPSFILTDGTKARITEPVEAFKIIEALFPE